MPERRQLKIESFDALRAEIARLRAGYERAGQWTLEQACYHLDHAMIAAMRPVQYQPNTPEQDDRRELFATVMRDHKIPEGLVAPPETAPPADVSETAIDSFLATVDRFERHAGPFSPHRLFGNLPPEVRKKHQLVHAAHHLSYLIPTNAK
jgi:hypothetical protein